MLAGDGRRSAKDAAAAVGRAGVCDLLPGVHDALATGAVSAGHADALARVSRELDDAGRSQLKELEETLVESASTSSVEAFEREMRDLSRILAGDDGLGRHERLRRQRAVERWVDRNTGMCHTHLQLDPEADARVSAALDAAIAAEQAKPDDDESRTFDQLKADAIVALLTGARNPRPAGARDHRARRPGHPAHGLHDGGICETGDGQPLPPATVRRLCCEAHILPVVLNGAGATLDLGREQRLANRAQRRALRAMYRTCGHPGCTVRFADCEIHHVIDWDPHGPTDLANLLPSAPGIITWCTKAAGRSPCTPTAPSPSTAPTAPCISRLHHRRRPHRPPQPPTPTSSNSPAPEPEPSAHPPEPPPPDEFVARAHGRLELVAGRDGDKRETS